MSTLQLYARSAPLAIAVSAAVLSTPVLAQDAAPQDPPIVLPTTEAPAAQPAIVLPDTAPAASDPMPSTAQEAPAAPVAVRTATTTRTVSRAVESPATATTATTVPAQGANTATTAVASSSMPPATPAVATDAVTPQQPDIVEKQANRTANVDDGLVAGLLAAFGLAGVGGVALLSARRRRQRAAEGLEYVEPAYPNVANELKAAPTPIVESREPAIILEPPVARSTFFGRPSFSTPNGHRDPVELPNEIPATVEERTALIQRLVDAPPDRANPFQSPKARTRRARMIVQSLHRRFVTRKPRIDLSEYTNRWPSLRGWSPATA